MTELEKFQQKFRTPACPIRAFRQWAWSLRPLHAPLGAGVISANRYEPHVHMRVIPRYATLRDFGGTTWTDESWPKPPNSSVGPTLVDDQAKAMIARILG